MELWIILKWNVQYSTLSTPNIMHGSPTQQSANQLPYPPSCLLRTVRPFSLLPEAHFINMLIASTPDPLAVWLSVISRQYRVGVVMGGGGGGDNFGKAPAGIIGAAPGDRLPPSVVWESPSY